MTKKWQIFEWKIKKKMKKMSQKMTKKNYKSQVENRLVYVDYGHFHVEGKHVITYNWCFFLFWECVMM